MPVLFLLLYLLLAALAWLFRAAYIGWFGPYVFFAALVLPPVLFLVSLPSMLSLQVRLKAPRRVMRGSDAMLTLDFSERRLLPVHAVTVHLEIQNRYNGETYHRNYIFRNLESSTCDIPLPTALCGQLHCALLRFECKDLLGLFTVRRKSGAEAFCTVMPAASEPDTPVTFETVLRSAAVLKPKYGGGFAEEHDLRDYRPGDTMNSIHWKLSSKTDSLIVREALVPENSTVFVVLNRVGPNDRGLEVLRWLSRKLCELEEPHVIVADSLYSVSSEDDADSAVASVLSWPMRECCGFERHNARCVFFISDGEVRTL